MKQDSRRLREISKEANMFSDRSSSQVPMDCTDESRASSTTTITTTSGIDNKQMNSLESKPQVKQSKLLSSKSLSQLVSRRFLFKSKSNDKPQDDGNIKTTKSFTFRPGNITNLFWNPDDKTVNGPSATASSSSSGSSKLDSSIVRQSSRLDNEFGNETFFNSQKPNFSPIIGQVQADPIVNSELFGGSSSGVQVALEGSADDSEGASSDKKKKDEEKKKKDNKSKKYKPFKNTGLVLRDVKNSLSLRLKAKHDSQAFVKLTEEFATPPTKLYSPFDICTPDGGKSGAKSGRTKKSGGGQVNLASEEMSPMMTPKVRAALQHKRHLVNKFTFDSPTGRVRAGAQDVETFMQCIADISNEIRGRDSL